MPWHIAVTQGRQLVTPASSAPSKSPSSFDQLQAYLGYGGALEHQIPSRGTLGSEVSTPHFPHSGVSSPKHTAPGTAKSQRPSHRSVSPVARSLAAHPSEDAQHALGYSTKRKGEHDLSPAQQRAFQFRSAINKSTSKYGMVVERPSGDTWEGNGAGLDCRTAGG